MEGRECGCGKKTAVKYVMGPWHEEGKCRMWSPFSPPPAKRSYEQMQEDVNRERRKMVEAAKEQKR